MLNSQSYLVIIPPISNDNLAGIWTRVTPLHEHIFRKKLTVEVKLTHDFQFGARRSNMSVECCGVSFIVISARRCTFTTKVNFFPRMLHGEAKHVSNTYGVFG